MGWWTQVNNPSFNKPEGQASVRSCIWLYPSFIFCIMTRPLLRGAWRAIRLLRRMSLGLAMTSRSRARHRQCEYLVPFNLLSSFRDRFRIWCLSPRVARDISNNSFTTRSTFVAKISWGLKLVSLCTFANRVETSFCFCSSKECRLLSTSYLKH